MQKVSEIAESKVLKYENGENETMCTVTNLLIADFDRLPDSISVSKNQALKRNQNINKPKAP